MGAGGEEARLAALVEGTEHVRPRGDEQGVDTGADAGERAAAVARMEGYTKRDWRELRVLAAEGRIHGADLAALVRRTELQYPGAQAQVRSEYHTRWTRRQIVASLFGVHGASAASLSGWEDRLSKSALVERVLAADMAGMAEATAVEESTGRLWTPSSADVARRAGGGGRG